MTSDEILRWLREDRPEELDRLWEQADAVRRAHVGDAVHLRGLVEFSNYCARSCTYCGIRKENTGIERYRMSESEIMECVREIVRFGYGTVVLQSGEDPAVDSRWVADLVRAIKSETDLAVTLSLGEHGGDELRSWREAGADRYLLRFETSDSQLFGQIHPSRPLGHVDRREQLISMKQMGYEIGTGVLIGIPGQSYETLVRDIETFAELGIDMIGVGPYIPHSDTPLGADAEAAWAMSPDQVPATEDMTYKVVALSRIVCPDANIPSTTALATLNTDQGRELGLSRGANIVMPNVTPARYRALYEIYPGKACIQEEADDCNRCMLRRIHSIGRVPGTGRGNSPGFDSGAKPVYVASEEPVPKGRMLLNLPMMGGS